jgi:hypothetical protein
MLFTQPPQQPAPIPKPKDTGTQTVELKKGGKPTK